MATRQITASPSHLMVEQLVASGVKYVFYNPGSREAPFFDALHSHPDINGIVALHEGSVTAMAGGYTQVRNDPAVMTVHLGAGLAQSMGQLINVWTGSLPVVVITFAGDTGSFADRIGLDISHSFGPTSPAAPFVKASWTVIEPEGLPAAIERALRVAKTPPVGPVHLAIYDRLLGKEQVTADILEGEIPDLRAGYPSESDLESLASALHDAERPLLYVGDGVWKSGAEERLTALAEHFGAAVATTFGDARGVSVAHPLHCGRLDRAVAALDPDHIICIGVRHGGSGTPGDYAPFAGAKRVVALGSDVANLQNIPGLDLGILADERRALERLGELVLSESEPGRYDERRARARAVAAELRTERRDRLQPGSPQPGRVRPVALLDALDAELERVGGGLITTEQFATPLDCVPAKDGGGANTYIRPAGGSEGYGIGAALGAKLAAPDRPVVGLVGDGSLYYTDSGLWTGAHHGIPVLYVIPNNAAYGIVATIFGAAGGQMRESGQYAGVALEGIDPVVIAGGFGVEGERVDDETQVGDAIARGLATVEREKRPYLLDVRLPSGLPHGGRPAAPFQLADA
ncbi:MAG: thiamine pyrophosphate-binding protein [Dehalococcoidia bacterium]